MLRTLRLRNSSIAHKNVSRVQTQQQRTLALNCVDMLDFLATVRASMMSSRRTRPLPQDFIAALARHQARSSSELLEHVKLQLPLFARNQPILAPCPDDAPPANLEGLLGPELSGQGEKAERRYIPKHLPGFPSKHTWQASPVYQERETDPRKIREKATQEGVLAEAALRKLAGKRKQGMMHKNSETGHARIRRTQVDGAKVWEDALQALAEEDAEEKRRNEESGNLALAISLDASQEGASADWAGDAATDEAGLLVNYDRKFWRKGAQGNMASSR